MTAAMKNLVAKSFTQAIKDILNDSNLFWRMVDESRIEIYDAVDDIGFDICMVSNMLVRKCFEETGDEGERFEHGIKFYEVILCYENYGPESPKIRLFQADSVRSVLIEII